MSKQQTKRNQRIIELYRGEQIIQAEIARMFRLSRQRIFSIIKQNGRKNDNNKIS